ncbi:hypothetical protein WA026_011373 [Henosepilachna vigintioctopunctata]|uniref:Uncharacterized protein n=1 Tax=Henosepilachna vigintioctopunctata TaxID=420089 RepID=A0AAW1TLG8_9CUCU
MTTLWESSKRSLFVRTVWKDGHHHVLLQNDKMNNRQSVATKTTSQSRKNSSRIKTTESSFGQVSNNTRLKRFRSLRIDSVKSEKYKKVTIYDHEDLHTKPRTAGDTKNIFVDNRIRSQHNDHKYQKITTRSHTIDSGYEYRNSILAGEFPVGGGILKSYDQFTSLSDRVIVWLDLATQSGSCSRTLADFKKVTVEKPRVFTAKVNSKSSERTKINVLKMKESDENEKYNIYLEDDDYSSSDDSILKCNAMNLEREIVGLKDDKSIPTVDSEINKSVDKNEVISVPNDKRQLHIFMPILPKCLSELDDISVLSKNASVLH